MTGMLQLTGLYGGILTFYYIYLTYRTIKHRIKARVSIGDGTYEAMISWLSSDPHDQAQFKHVNARYEALRKAIRAHANFAETVPLFLILFGLAEVRLTHAWARPFLHGLGLSVLFGRIVHVHFGLMYPHSLGKGRQVGMACTLTPIILLAGLHIYLSLLA